MNKMFRVTIALVALSMLLVVVANGLAAASPGASPDTGLAPTCTYQPLGGGASVWYKIPYVFDNRAQFTLDEYGLDGISFAVYDSPTADKPMGQGMPNGNESGDLNWEGQLTGNGFFYVLVTNSEPYSLPYNFCTNEKDPWQSPQYYGATCEEFGSGPSGDSHSEGFFPCRKPW